MRLQDKRKLRGRWGAVSEESFIVQTAQGKTIADERIAFRDVKSVKAKQRGISTGVAIAIGASVAVGVLFLIAYALVAAGYGS